MIRHLFWRIDTVLRLNAATYGLQKWDISTKNMGQVDGVWLTKKKVLGW